MKNIEKFRRKNKKGYDRHSEDRSISGSRRPKNNMVFCVECGRRKQLFETEGEALRFIEYNSDNIENENGHAPCRAYHCPCCGGWHVTSRKEYTEPVKSHTDRLIEKYHEDRDNFGLWKKQHRVDTKLNLKWDEDKFEYVCLRLTNEARMRLFANIPQEYAHKWDRVFLDHVTLLHRLQYNKEDVGGKPAKVVRFVKNIISNESQSGRVHFVVDGIGCSDKAVAFRVNLSVPCCNPHPHITIGTIGDGRPVHSNEITEWVDIPKMSVDALVEVVYPKKTEAESETSEFNVNII